MSILFENPFNDKTWVAELQQLLPDDEFKIWPDHGDPADIEFIIMWSIPVKELAQFTNAKALLMVGAGVNHLGPLDELPDIPIVRLIDPAVAHDMAAYAMHWVLHNHRHFDRYAQQQRDLIWESHRYVAAPDYTVGVAGMGNIGGAVVRAATALGYNVRGLTRSGAPMDDVTTYATTDFAEFMTDVDALVNVLPVTADTIGVIDASALRRMRPGGIFINMGRAASVDEPALIAALDAGHLAGAALDVFATEPLPVESPLWSHPKVHVTPHISGSTYARSAAKYLADNIIRMRDGENPYPVVDRLAGY